MILCRYRGDWYLSTGISRERGLCTLRCSPAMPHPRDFKPLPPVGAVLYGSVPDVEEITFFPEIRRLGYPLQPVAWHTESEEPMLKCYLSNPVVGKQIKEFDDLAKRAREYDERIVALKVDGWHWPDPREGCEKYLHVDELEKVEGPPPDGPF